MATAANGADAAAAEAATAEAAAEANSKQIATKACVLLKNAYGGNDKKATRKTPTTIGECRAMCHAAMKAGNRAEVRRLMTIKRRMDKENRSLKSASRMQSRWAGRRLPPGSR